MGKTKRNKVKAKAKQRIKQVPAGPTSVNDLPDELLDAVLLNVGTSPLHLIRAAATCKRWRLAIADAGFLARSHALHGAPPVAGRYYVTDKLPPKPAAFVPSSSPAVVDASHFSLDFLYVPPVEGDHPRSRYYYRPRRRTGHSRSREIVDSHGSLLLLTSRPSSNSIHFRRRSPDFIVCEPVSRRYQGIARPADLSHATFLGAFLQDGGGDDGDAMSNFKVLSVHYERHFRPLRYQFCTPRACVFTPGSDGGWRIGWHTTDDDDDDDVEVPDMETIHFAGRCAGKVYWGTESNSVFVLDESTLKFSVLTFPAPLQWPYRSRTTSFRVVGGDKVRVVRMDGDALEVFGQLPDSGEWVMERSISLRDATANLAGWEYWLFRLPASIVSADSTFMVLVLTPGEKNWPFSVDLETMEVDNEHVRNRDLRPSYPCALPWPPVLKACVNHGDATGKRRHTRQRRRCSW